MTRKERMWAAIRHQPVDRMPVSTYGLHPYHTSRHAGDASYAPLLKQVVESSGMLCKVGVGNMQPHLSERLVERQVEKLPDRTVTTRILQTRKGPLRSITDKPVDQPGYVTEHFLKNDQDIEKFLSIDIEPTEPDVSAAMRLHDELGDRGLVWLGYPDPMNVVADLFDFEDFVLRCVDDPAGILRIIDFVFEFLCEQVRRLAGLCQGRDLLPATGGPEKATPPMMPPTLFARLVTPYQKRLVDIFHEANLSVVLHCHGRVRQVLEEVMTCGFDAMEPIEPPPQGDITLAELLEKTAGRIAVIGHIQDQDLHNARPGHFTRFVDEVRKVVDGRTGYIMTPTATPFQFPAAERFVANYSEWLRAACGP